MEMPKASDADKEHFRSLLPQQPGVVQPMFGNLGAFAWVEKAFEHGAGLPPKEPKPRGTKG